MTAFPIDKSTIAPARDTAHTHNVAHAHVETGFVRKYILSTDHKIIGIQFMLVGLFFFVIGGLLALLIRMQLGYPGHTVPILGAYMKAKGFVGWEKGSMPPDFYSVAFSMHGTLMIFFVLIPLLVGAFGNYLIPLKVGAADMAFPFLNGMAFWLALPAGTIMLASFFLIGGAAQNGWTVYPPLSTRQESGTARVELTPPTSAFDDLIYRLRLSSRGGVLIGSIAQDANSATVNQSYAGDPVQVIEGATAAAQSLEGWSIVNTAKDSLTVKTNTGQELTLRFAAQNRRGTITAATSDKSAPIARQMFEKIASMLGGEPKAQGDKLTGEFSGYAQPVSAAVRQAALSLGLTVAATDQKNAISFSLPKTAGETEAEKLDIVIAPDPADGVASIATTAETIKPARQFLARTSTKLKAMPEARPWASSWSSIPLLTNLLALFLTYLYICAYYITFLPGSRHAAVVGLKRFIGTAALLMAFGLILLMTLAPIFPKHLAQYSEGYVEKFGALAAVGLLIEGAVLFFGGGIKHHVAVAISLTAAFFTLKGVQMAAFDGQSAWFLSIIILGFSSIMGAVNYLTTIVKLRCPGMTMFRLPLSVWSLFITSILVLLATPVLAGVLTMNLLDHHRLTGFFTPFHWISSNAFEAGYMGAGTSGGGYPLLHQHLFWFYSHPAVYIMIVPAMGMVSDIMAVFSRKPVFGYRPMIYAMAAIAFLGFIVWAHHMFQSGMNPTLGTTFAVSTMFIAVPSAIKVFNWLGTMWGGNIRFTTPMLNAIAFVAMFVIGGLSGIFMALTAIDVHIHDTYFIVAHIHYVLFGGSMFGIFASIYFWYPKMFGRMMSETLGKIHFWLTFIAFNCTFFAMHILGLSGMARRLYDYTNYPDFTRWAPMNKFITISAFALGIAQLPFVINFIGSWIWGRKAGNNPWLATTLEWNDAASPPPHGNFATVPVVHHGPYEYSTPLVEEDWLAQTRQIVVPEGVVVATGH